MKLPLLAPLLILAFLGHLAPSARGQDLTQLHEWTQVEPGDYFGAHLASAGDVDGDGFEDILLGVKYHDSGGYLDNGLASLYSGAAPDQLLFSVWLPESGAYLGGKVSSLGDINHDGYADFAVGASAKNIPGVGADAGTLGVFLGGTTVSLHFWFDDPLFGQRLAFAIGLPDLDGDGWDEIAMSGNGWGYSSRSGIVHIVSGQTGVLLADLDRGPGAGHDLLGTDMSRGDFNADGQDDLAVGAPGYGDGEITTDSGLVAIFDGTTLLDGPSATLLATIVSPNPEVNGFFGTTAKFSTPRFGSAGASLFVGAPLERAEAGRVYAYRHDAINGATLVMQIDGDFGAGSRFGNLMSASGSDITGDGSPELLVSAHLASGNGHTHNGALVIFDGAALDGNGGTPVAHRLDTVWGQVDEEKLGAVAIIADQTKNTASPVHDDATPEILLGDVNHSSQVTNKVYLLSFLPALRLISVARPSSTVRVEIRGVAQDHAFLAVAASNLLQGVPFPLTDGNLWLPLPPSLFYDVGVLDGNPLYVDLTLPPTPAYTFFLQSLHLRHTDGDERRFSNVVRVDIP